MTRGVWDLLSTTDYLMLGAAVIAIVVGIVGRDFYWANGGFSSNRKAPVWAGRTVFIGTGLILFIVECSRIYYK